MSKIRRYCIKLIQHHLILKDVLNALSTSKVLSMICKIPSEVFPQLTCENIAF